jgi:hypothetical protein
MNGTKSITPILAAPKTDAHPANAATHLIQALVWIAELAPRVSQTSYGDEIVFPAGSTVTFVCIDLQISVEPIEQTQWHCPLGSAVVATEP